MARPKAFEREKAEWQAMQLFWRKGYAATSIENLVEALELSRSSLYDTFGDKRSLFLMVLRQYSQQVTDRISALMTRTDQPTVAIRLFFDDLIKGSESSQGAQGCFMVNSVAELVPYDAEVTGIAAEYAATVQAILTDAFARAEAAGLMVPKSPPTQLAAYTFNAMQGIRLMIKIGASRDQLSAIADMTLKALA